MFTRVLVPLDGSDRAERALPVAMRLALASGGSLVLVRVATESYYAPAALGYALDNADALVAPVNEAEAYLKAVAAREELARVPVTTLAAIGTPAVEILETAREKHVDAIVMCSHGRTGLAKWAMGSVAQKVARHSIVPVLVLKDGVPTPQALASAQAPSLRVVIPLDASPLAEAAIAPALELLTCLGTDGSAELHLLRVLDLSTIYGRVGVDADQDRTVQTAITASAQEYLTAMADQVRRQLPGALSHARVTWSVATGIDPASVITETATGHAPGASDEHAKPFDLIAMATHGRGGLGLWAVGSVTEQVLTSTVSPVLVVRPVRQQEYRDETATVSAEPSEPWSTPLF
jgi:nucleotide-binding universal stress UspA family protein